MSKQLFTHFLEITTSKTAVEYLRQPFWWLTFGQLLYMHMQSGQNYGFQWGAINSNF